MRDFFNAGGAVLVALFFAAAQLGDLYAPQRAKVSRASLLSLTPSLSDYADALADGTVLDAARARLEAYRDALAEAARG